MEKRKLPNAIAVLVLGILSILTCWCYGIVGLILGVVALVLAAQDMKRYNENPELYTDVSNVNIGRILAIIGISLSTIFLALVIYLVSLGADGIKDFERNLKIKIDQQESEE
jgi:ABC-type Fe3+-siderophore transport system permease subunit